MLRRMTILASGWLAISIRAKKSLGFRKFGTNVWAVNEALGACPVSSGKAVLS
jgi:hypothetical protein